MKKLFEILWFASAAVMIGLFVWGANKGFDLSDEGLYILNLLYPEETAPYWKYGFIFNQLFGWMDLEVMGYRIVKLLLLLLVSGFLAFEWNKSDWSRNGSLQLGLFPVWALFFIGSTACYAIGPPTLSYNDLGLIYSMAILCLFLRYYRVGIQKIKGSFFSFDLLFSGGLFGFLLFAKFSAAVFVGICISILLFVIAIVKNQSLRELFLVFSNIAVGLAGSVAYHFLNIGDVFEYFENFQRSISIVPGHDSITLFKVYTSSLRTSFVEGFIYYLEIPALLGILYFLRRRQVLSDSVINKLFVIFPFYLALRFYASDFHLSGTTHSLTAFNAYFSGLLMMISILIYERKAIQFTPIQISIGIALLALPFTLALGTNNPLPLQASLYQIYWLVLFVLLTNSLHSNYIHFSRLFITLFALVSLSQAVHGYYFKPYRIPGTLADQEVQVDNNRKKINLKVHLTFNAFVTQIDSILQENCLLESPHPLMSMFYDPGICYLLDGIGPGSSWFKYSSDALNCFNVSYTKLSNFDKSIIISENGGLLREPFIDCLNEKGFNFPASYRMIGKAIHPIYGTQVFVMAPRQILHIFNNSEPNP